MRMAHLRTIWSRFSNNMGFERKHAIYHTLYDEDATFPAWGECLFVKR